MATLVAYGASTYVLNGNDGNTGFGGLWGAEGVRVVGGWWGGGAGKEIQSWQLSVSAAHARMFYEIILFSLCYTSWGISLSFRDISSGRLGLRDTLSMAGTALINRAGPVYRKYIEINRHPCVPHQRSGAV